MAIQSSSKLNDWTFQRVVGATLTLFFVVLAFWLLFRFYQVVFILFISILMGTVIRPVVDWLSQRGLPRTVGAILVYVLLLVLLVGFILLLFPLIIEQGTKLSTAIPGYYQGLRDWLINNPNQLLVRLGSFLPWTVPGSQQVEQTGEQVLASSEQALDYLSLVVKAVFITITILLIAFHWALNGERVIQSLLSLVPKRLRESTQELFSAMESKIGFYIAGQGALCLIIAILSLISYLLIGLPNALLLALIAGVLEAVPMIGPILGAIPAAAVALSIAPSKLIWVILSMAIIQQLENSILVPRVMRKAVGVNPFVSLLAIFAFSTLFGIAGALMAIPLAAIIQILLDRFVFLPGVGETDDFSGRDNASLLRYKAQDLIQDLRKQSRLKKKGSILEVKQIDKLMDEIEAITTDLDALLSQVPPSSTL